MTPCYSPPPTLHLVSASAQEKAPFADLIELPSDFIERSVPIVTFSVGDSPGGAKKRFILDTGAPVSIIFAKSTAGREAALVHLALRNSDGESFGRFQFAQVPNPPHVGLKEALKKRHVAGIVGIDFFRKHDIVIDYGNQRVYVVDPKAKDFYSRLQATKGCERLDLIPYGDSYRVPTLTASKTLSLALLDSGSTRSTFPLLVGGEPPANRQATTNFMWNRTIEGWTDNLQLTVGGSEQPFEIQALFANIDDYILAPSSLGRSVVFALRKSEIWVYRR
jgi:hypothetical protein